MKMAVQFKNNSEFGKNLFIYFKIQP